MLKVYSFINDIRYNLLKFVYRSFIIKEINGSKMRLYFDDTGIAKNLILHKRREPFSTQRLKQILSSTDVCLDIGANIGYYALLEKQIAQKVIAIEPVPQNLKRLEENIYLNGVTINTYQYGVSDVSGKEKIYFTEKSNLSTFRTPDCKVKEIIEVPTITLDDLIGLLPQTPTFLRMDVEGYEYKILKGAKKILESGCPLKMFIELELYILTPQELDWILKTLQKYNFRVDSLFWETPDMIGLYPLIRLLSKINKNKILFNQGYVGNSYEDIKKSMGKYGWLDCFFIRE